MPVFLFFGWLFLAVLFLHIYILDNNITINYLGLISNGLIYDIEIIKLLKEFNVNINFEEVINFAFKNK